MGPLSAKGQRGSFLFRQSCLGRINFAGLMARALGIDYGLKRTGIAVTDPLRILVQVLAHLDTNDFEHFIDTYLIKEKVDLIVFGSPFHRDGTPTELNQQIQTVVKKMALRYPLIKFDFQNEHLTSVEAMKTLVKKGTPLKKRTKAAVDQMSAVLILQKYLNHY
jgi:putative Holliday junction resolvase